MTLIKDHWFELQLDLPLIWSSWHFGRITDETSRAISQSLIGKWPGSWVDERASAWFWSTPEQCWCWLVGHYADYPGPGYFYWLRCRHWGRHRNMQRKNEGSGMPSDKHWKQRGTPSPPFTSTQKGRIPLNFTLCRRPVMKFLINCNMLFVTQRVWVCARRRPCCTMSNTLA